MTSLILTGFGIIRHIVVSYARKPIFGYLANIKVSEKVNNNFNINARHFSTFSKSSLNVSKRYYHSTTPTSIELGALVVGVLKFLGLKKGAAAAPLAVAQQQPLFPGEYFIKGSKQLVGVVYIAGKSTLYDFMFWKVAIACGVCVTTMIFAGFTLEKLHLYMEFINMYQQICPTSEAVVAVNQLPDLSPFNLKSVDLLHAKVTFWSKEKIELMVKYFVNNNIPVYKNVLIDLTNTLE